MIDVRRVGGGLRSLRKFSFIVFFIIFTIIDTVNSRVAMAILEFVSECACKTGRRRSAVSYLSNYRSYKPTHDACSTNHIAEDEQYDRSS